MPGQYNQCPFCKPTKSYSTTQELQNHIHAEHDGVFFYCILCKTLVRSFSISGHFQRIGHKQLYEYVKKATTDKDLVVKRGHAIGTFMYAFLDFMVDFYKIRNMVSRQQVDQFKDDDVDDDDLRELFF